MTELLFTEGKNTGMVRVFINHDYNYGYFIDEKYLSIILDENQLQIYKNNGDQTFMVSDEKIDIIHNYGLTYP
jgi:hypothetical protein